MLEISRISETSKRICDRNVYRHHHHQEFKTRIETFSVILGEALRNIITNRTARFWVITNQVVVISYRRFGTTYRSHLQGSRNQIMPSSQLLGGGSLKSRIKVFTFVSFTKFWVIFQVLRAVFLGCYVVQFGNGLLRFRRHICLQFSA